MKHGFPLFVSQDRQVCSEAVPCVSAGDAPARQAGEGRVGCSGVLGLAV